MSISGQEWQKVAFDEAHKMCTNKNLKSAVVHPSQAYLQKHPYFSIIV